MMRYSKIFENIDYNKLVTSYKTFVTAKEKYNKDLKEIKPLAIFIYKTIWETYGSDYQDFFEGHMENMNGYYGDLFLDEIDVDKGGIILYYKIELNYKYGDPDYNDECYLELSREQFEEFKERFKMSHETNKYNL